MEADAYIARTRCCGAVPSATARSKSLRLTTMPELKLYAKYTSRSSCSIELESGLPSAVHGSFWECWLFGLTYEVEAPFSTVASCNGAFDDASELPESLRFRLPGRALVLASSLRFGGSGYEHAVSSLVHLAQIGCSREHRSYALSTSVRPRTCNIIIAHFLLAAATTSNLC